MTGKDNILVVNKAVHKSLKNYLEKVQPRNSDYLFASRKGNKATTRLGKCMPITISPFLHQALS